MNLSRMNWNQCFYRFLMSTLTTKYHHRSQICGLYNPVRFQQNCCSGSSFGPHRKRYLDNVLQEEVCSGLRFCSSGPAKKFTGHLKDIRQYTTIPSQKVEVVWPKRTSEESTASGATHKSQTTTLEQNTPQKGDVGEVDLRHNSGQNSEVETEYGNAGGSTKSSARSEGIQKSGTGMDRSGESTSVQSSGASVGGPLSKGSEAQLSGICVQNSKYAQNQEAKPGGENASVKLGSGFKKVLEGGKEPGDSHLTYKDVEARGREKGKKLSGSREGLKTALGKSKEHGLAKGETVKDGKSEKIGREKSSSAKSKQTDLKGSKQVTKKPLVQNKIDIQQEEITPKKVTKTKSNKKAKEKGGMTSSKLGSGKQSHQSSDAVQQKGERTKKVEKKLNTGTTKTTKRSEQFRPGSRATGTSSSERLDVSHRSPPVTGKDRAQRRKLVLLDPEIPPSQLLSEDGSRILVFLRKMFICRPESAKPKMVGKTENLSMRTQKAAGPLAAPTRTKIDKLASASATDEGVKSSGDMSHAQSHDPPIVRENKMSDNVLTTIVGDKVREGLGDIISSPGVSKRPLVENVRENHEEGASLSKKRHKKKVQKAPQRKRLSHEEPDRYIIPVLDICVYTGKMDFAQSVFDTCMLQGSFKDPRVFNLVLEGWATKGNIEAIKKLFTVMSSSDVQPDLESFAYVLECIGRMKPLDKTLAQRCIDDLERGGMNLNDLMRLIKFKRDSREVVLSVIQAVRPDFEQPPPLEWPLCSLEVVNKLYCDRSPGMGHLEPLSGIFSNEELRRRMDLQWGTEERECISIKSVEEETHPSQLVLDKRKALAEHKGLWRRALKKGLEIQKRKHQHKTSFAHFKEHVYPFMTILNDDDYVQLMMETLPKFAATSEGIGNLNLARELGSRVNQRYIIRKKRKNLVADKTRKIYLDYMHHLMDGCHGDHTAHRELWQHLLDENPEGPSLDFETHVWPSVIVLKIGNFLADILLREIQIDAHSKSGKKFIPGLYHMYAYRSMKQVGFIKPHPLLIDLFQGAKDPDLPFDSNILPMVTPPLPWMSARFGGYPLSATKLMRCKEGSLQAKLISDKADTPELHPVLDSLNQLSTVPWIVNKKVLDMVIDIFKKEGSKELDIPQPASAFPPPPPIKSDASPEEIAQIHQERAAMRKTQAEMHSLRMDMLYKLSIANHFRDEIIWFPHNMDFRGRVYPCPPHFNHLGSDVTRSLLLFAQGKPLGEEGLDWLKIHLINLSGHKKRFSLEDRLAYANDILPDILDSAERPIEGKKWWQTADEPWQVLACCMEIADALKSPDPTKYIGHLPIHQDGSCNGLQHYAALGRDVIGAQQVNLHPFPVPQDVYSGVAQMVEDLRQKDADNGIKIAEALAGSVQRKVVKQTVMTVVYGVTAFGGRHQIYRQLKDMEVMSEDDAWFAASYLVQKVFLSLGKMFAKTREIQDWLTESALMIAKGGSSVEWVTPLGLPIVQPYHKKSQMWVSTTEQWSLYHNESTNAKGRPDAQKQKNAFPPNFIHSLDSTHMMLTSLHCQRAGVTFASVHDCFWTHACSVNVMNEICREQFVRLHGLPILHDLARYLSERFGDIEIDPGVRMKEVNPLELNYVKDYLRKVPDTGDYDLQNVLKSTYFFS